MTSAVPNHVISCLVFSVIMVHLQMVTMRMVEDSVGTCGVVLEPRERQLSLQVKILNALPFSIICKYIPAVLLKFYCFQTFQICNLIHVYIREGIWWPRKHSLYRTPLHLHLLKSTLKWFCTGNANCNSALLNTIL